MSKDDDDETGAYVAVPGFSIPFERVLDAKERPVNADGSRTGSMFLTIDGCTFTGEGENAGIKGDATSTCGAPNVVVTVRGPGKRESVYIVSAKDMIKVAIEAHKARKDWPNTQMK